MPRHTVLLVDDEKAIRQSVPPVLERSGFAVTTAEHGDEALTLQRACAFDIVVSDIMMPVLDGRELVRRMRLAQDWTPVILLTRIDEPFERSAALDEGADDYLNKPFEIAELVARIRAVLRRTTPGTRPLTASATLTCGSLILDRAARRVWLEHREIALTPKALMLLDYLMTHPGELHSRESLLGALWGFEFPVSSRAVDHRIAEIRRTLGDDPAAPRFVATAPGHGYRFIGLVRSGT